jgi:hypothetical protein
LLSPFRSIVRIVAIRAIFAKSVAAIPVWARYFGTLYFGIPHSKVSLGGLSFALSPFPFSPIL